MPHQTELTQARAPRAAWRDELPLAGRQMELRNFQRAADSTDAAAPLARARLVFTAGGAVRRFDYYRERVYMERLVVEEGAIRLDRLQRGAPLLNTHNSYSLEAQLGVCDNPAIRAGLGECDVAFSRRESVAGFVQDVEDGIIRNVSVGYVRHRVEMVPPAQEGGVWEYRVVDWEPYEVSLVPVPADMDAQVRGASGPDVQGAQPLRSFPCEFVEVRATTSPQDTTRNAGHSTHPGVTAMPGAIQTTTQSTPDAERAATDSAVTDLCRRNGALDLLPRLIRDGATLAQASSLILETRAAASDAIGDAQRNVSPGTGRANPQAYMRNGPVIDRDASLVQMVDAVVARMGGPALQAENPYRHSRMVDLGRECLEQSGVRTGGLSPGQVIERALHTTSDFPNLLSAVGQRVLRNAYNTAPSGIKRIARPSTSVDFRAKSRLQLGEAPTLLKVNESGEFKRGTMAEAATSYALATYGRIFGITRQALVNDDLDAFGDMAARLGRAAAEFEASFLVQLLTGNPVMNDSVALFHASHGNLATGAPSALQLSALTTARTAMRLQKGLDGKTPIDATPRFLVVPAALETTAEQLITALQAAQVSNVNPFAGKLEPVVDPRLDAISSTAWYLAADPGIIDTVEYAYLEQAGGPEIIQREGFEVDGVEMKVRLDFGGGVLDWRGLYKSNGA